MKIWILSDLHLEFGEWDIPEVDADVLVLAGDIHTRGSMIDWISTNRAKLPPQIVFVAGNHEYYGRMMHGDMKKVLKEGEDTIDGFHFLDNEAVVIDGVRFLGSTLWTDCLLYGDPKLTLSTWDGMYDYHAIRMDNGCVMKPDDSRKMCRDSVEWLKAAIPTPHEGPTVVVTHHSPSSKSIHPRFEGSLMNGFFASNLEHLFPGVDLWIHGHMHDGVDYTVDQTRVIANPAGYPSRFCTSSRENPTFNPQLVIEI